MTSVSKVLSSDRGLGPRYETATEVLGLQDLGLAEDRSLAEDHSLAEDRGLAENGHLFGIFRAHLHFQ